MKLSSVMRDVTVRSLAGGVIEVRPDWLASPGLLTRMAVAAEIERRLRKQLPKAVKRRAGGKP